MPNFRTRKSRDSGGKKKPSNEKAKTVKAKDTATSPYYKVQTGKNPAMKAASKREMKDYFSPSIHNRRGESESQHMSRMKKREDANRKALGLKKKG